MRTKRAAAQRSPMDRLKQKYRDAVSNSGEEMRRPSDLYLAAWLQARPADERHEPDDIDLNHLYWLEQAETWLRNRHNSTPSDHTLPMLRQQWAVDLHETWPPPEIIPAVQEVLRRRMQGESIESIIASDPSLATTAVENQALVNTYDVLVTANRHYYQTRLWAWERLRLLHHPRLGGGETSDGPLWQLSSEEPPDWLLATLGHYLDPISDNDHSAQHLVTARSSCHPIIHAYGPVNTGLEGLWRFEERSNIIRGGNRPPYVITPNGGVVSIGGDLATVMDGAQEAAAFAAGLKLSDDTAVAFVLGLARWCARADRHDRRSYVPVTVDDYCQARGWRKQAHRGFKTEHKARAREEMMALNKVWVRHQVPDHL